MRIKHYNHILAMCALLLIFAVFNSVAALAQIKVSGTDVSAQQFLLRGKIINQQKQPVELANVLLLKDSLQVQAVLTDSLGGFTLKAGKGVYTLLSERFGNQFFKKEIQLDQDTDLGDLEVNESVMLEGVTIEARKKLIERQVNLTG